MQQAKKTETERKRVRSERQETTKQKEPPPPKICREKGRGGKRVCEKVCVYLWSCLFRGGKGGGREGREG